MKYTYDRHWRPKEVNIDLYNKEELIFLATNRPFFDTKEEVENYILMQSIEPNWDM